VSSPIATGSRPYVTRISRGRATSPNQRRIWTAERTDGGALRLLNHLRGSVLCTNEATDSYDFAGTRAFVPWGADLKYCTGQGTG
jgi:hypothetical protein